MRGSARAPRASPGLPRPVRSRSGSRTLSELKKGVAPRYAPSVHIATSNASPGRAADPCNGTRADPVHAAETAAGPPTVKWPPTTGTPKSSAARAIPSSTASAWRRSGLTTVSTMAIGRPPIARTSATFVATAATPAAYGWSRANPGAIASAHMIRNVSPNGMTAPSSPARSPSRLKILRLRFARRPGAPRTTETRCSNGSMWAAIAEVNETTRSETR